ncbi:MAG: helix-turn-helix transcriptional regulator [Sphingomicrobium sp.]
MASVALEMGRQLFMEHMVPGPVDKLNARQLDCLRLVAQNLSSKEIAAELGISPHTVDQRVRQALQILGVERRAQAARMVLTEAGPYQRLIHQPPYIAAVPPADHQGPAISHQIRHADRAEGAGENGLLTEQSSLLRSPLVLPFATRSHPRNEMSVGLRLMWIFIIAIGATFSAGMYLAGLESLSRMIAH